MSEFPVPNQDDQRSRQLDQAITGELQQVHVGLDTPNDQELALTGIRRVAMTLFQGGNFLYTGVDALVNGFSKAEEHSLRRTDKFKKELSSQ